jgi:hypothetical protein
LRTIVLLPLAACGFHSPAAAEVDSGVATVDAPLGTPSATPCPGYAFLEPALIPSSYLVVTAPARFKSAEQSCEASQGHLVIVDNDAERRLVAAMITDAWVGFSDLKNEGTWIDVAGRTSSYLAAHWAMNEPSMSGNDNCAFLMGASGLNATNCGNADGGDGDMHGFVCECGDALQGSTSNFHRPD